MSKNLLKEYIDRLDAIAAGESIQEDAVDAAHLSLSLIHI